MKSLVKCLNLTVILFMVFAGIAVAAEWYESMESSGIEQSYAVLKNIATSGSMTERRDVQQAIAEISESVMKEAAQIAEGTSVRELDASHPSESKGDRQGTASTRQNNGPLGDPVFTGIPICP